MIFGENTVTVNNYYECLNYADGGYIKQSSEKYFFNYDRETPHYFYQVDSFTICNFVSCNLERKFKNIKLND